MILTKTTLAWAASLLVMSGVGGAAPLTFDFKDPKGVNSAVFKLDAPLEAITGSANGIRGQVTFDPAKPEATRGRIVVEAESLHVPNPVMKQYLHGDQWMHVSRHPEITFEAKAFKNVKTLGDQITADVTGTMTMKDISKEMTVPVKLTYLKDKLGLRVPNQEGDLLVLRANFSIQRSAFGIHPKAPEEKVSDTIELSLSIAGAAPRR